MVCLERPSSKRANFKCQCSFPSWIRQPERSFSAFRSILGVKVLVDQVWPPSLLERRLRRISPPPPGRRVASYLFALPPPSAPRNRRLNKILPLGFFREAGLCYSVLSRELMRPNVRPFCTSITVYRPFQAYIWSYL